MVFVKPPMLLLAVLAICGERHASAVLAPVWDPLADTTLMPMASTAAVLSPESLSLPLYNFHDVLYYFEMQVGTPPQTVRVGVDTTMASIGITTVKGDTHHVYNHSDSSTYKPDGRPYAFRDGMSGVLVQDRLALGNSTAAAFNQSFVEITNVTSYGPAYPFIPNDGWFGIGKSLKNAGGFPTLVITLAKQGVLNAPCVTLTAPSGKNGQIGFGGPSHKHAVVPTDPHPDLWGFDVLGIKVGDSPIQADATEATKTHGFAAMDLMVPYVAGPVDTVTEIAKMVGGTLLDYGLFSVPCDANLPNITFVVALVTEHGSEEGLTFTLTKNELIGRRVSEKDCELNIAPRRFPSPHELADWTLGAPLFHRYSFLFCWHGGLDAAPSLATALHA